MGQMIGYLIRGGRDYKITGVAVVMSEPECVSVIGKLRNECKRSFPVLGMDCEWVPDGEVKHPVALLQLASLSGFCALFRLSHMSSIPESVKDILEDRNILKVGVGIENDVCRLRTNVRSWVDIRHMECLVLEYPFQHADVGELANGNRIKLGLASLTKRVLGIELNKDNNVRLGKWDCDELTEDQIKYASWDALAPVYISFELIQQDGIVETYDLRKPVDFLKQISELHYPSGECAAARNSPMETGVRSRETTSKRHYSILPSRRNPMYDNIFLLAPDGEVLCTCDRKRAMWYVDKGIGELIEENSEPLDDDVDGQNKSCLKVKLKFEPKRRAVTESEKYYCIVKANRCVVCGKEDSYLRKHVVPHEYRKFFPVWMKSRQSHDVLLLCIDCHIQSNCIDLKLRKKLAEDCGAPMTLLKAVEVQDAPMIKKVQSAARVLSRNPDNIPEGRLKELKEIVLNYFLSQEGNTSSQGEVTPDMLTAAMDLTLRIGNEAYAPHGLKVVQHFQKMGEENGIRELEILWRQHFVSEMRPRYLPPMWSIHHTRLSPARKELESSQCGQSQE